MVYQTDVKRPDEVSIVPWKGDKILVWDVKMSRQHGTSPLISGFMRSWFCDPRGRIQEDSDVFPPFSHTFLCPNRCGVDGCVWPRRIKQLSRISPMYKEHSR